MGVPFAIPTHRTAFSKYATFGPLPFIFLPSASASENKPSANPVSLVTAEMRSWINRKGGRFRSFEVSFGFAMRPANACRIFLCVKTNFFWRACRRRRESEKERDLRLVSRWHPYHFSYDNVFQIDIYFTTKFVQFRTFFLSFCEWVSGCCLFFFFEKKKHETTKPTFFRWALYTVDGVMFFFFCILHHEKHTHT